MFVLLKFKLQSQCVKIIIVIQFCICTWLELGRIVLLFVSIFSNNKEEHQKSIFTQCDKRGFQLKDSVQFHLYISTSPCGDARIFSPHEAAVEGETESYTGSSRGWMRMYFTQTRLKWMIKTEYLFSIKIRIGPLMIRSHFIIISLECLTAFQKQISSVFLISWLCRLPLWLDLILLLSVVFESFCLLAYVIQLLSSWSSKKYKQLLFFMLVLLVD